nr:E3 ubiquitin-protein ligase RZFP34-like isoform X3 [Nicotiana tomentosiformis]
MGLAFGIIKVLARNLHVINQKPLNFSLVKKMETGSHEQGISHSLAVDESMTEMGSGNFGCSHYRRRCKIRAPCCDEIFDCRHCHNDSKNSLEVDPLKRHDVPRHDIKRVICSLCNTEQDVQQTCVNCGVCMGKYYCSKCNFFDDDVSKDQYHCDKCGICRTGGNNNFFHCNRCECCYSNLMKESHICVERAMHHNCPVRFEYIFDTTKNITVLPCGHTMHLECVMQMEQHFQ